MSGIHCGTCTCAPGTPDRFCDSEVTIKHERMNHAGPHKGSILGAPCAGCGGYEEHSDSCPTPDEVNDTFDTSTGELIWRSNGTILTEGVA